MRSWQWDCSSKIVSRDRPRASCWPKPGNVCYGRSIAMVALCALAGGKAPVLCVTVERQGRGSPAALPEEDRWQAPERSCLERV